MYCGGPGWLCMGCGWPELARLATHSFCRGNSVQLGAVQFDSVQLGSVQFGSTQFSSVQFGSIRFNSHRRPHVSSAVHVDVLRPANNQPTLPGVSRYFPAVPWLSPGVSQRPRCLPAVSPPPGCLPAVSRMSPECLPASQMSPGVSRFLLLLLDWASALVSFPVQPGWSSHLHVRSSPDWAKGTKFGIIC